MKELMNEDILSLTQLFQQTLALLILTVQIYLELEIRQVKYRAASIFISNAFSLVIIKNSATTASRLNYKFMGTKK